MVATVYLGRDYKVEVDIRKKLVGSMRVQVGKERVPVWVQLTYLEAAAINVILNKFDEGRN